MAILLITPCNFPKNTFNIGWLKEFQDGGVYTTWGNGETPEALQKAVKESKHKDRDIYFYNNPVNEILTTEEVKKIKYESIKGELPDEFNA